MEKRHTCTTSWSQGRLIGLQISRTKLQGVPSLNTRVISYGSTKASKALNKRLHSGKQTSDSNMATSSQYRSQVSRCRFFREDRADIPSKVNELCERTVSRGRTADGRVRVECLFFLCSIQSFSVRDGVSAEHVRHGHI